MADFNKWQDNTSPDDKIAALEQKNAELEEKAKELIGEKSGLTAALLNRDAMILSLNQDNALLRKQLAESEEICKRYFHERT